MASLALTSGKQHFEQPLLEHDLYNLFDNREEARMVHTDAALQ